VWDSEYVLVQHLNETSGIHFDSTSNNNDATPYGNVNQNIIGKIGIADDFDGNDDYLKVVGTSSLRITGDVTFTSAGRINWTKTTANGVTLNNFTSSDTVSDLQTHNDGNTYTVSEVAGGNNYLIVDFANVSAFNWIHIIAAYSGSSAHVVGIQLEITPFDGSTWHTLSVLDSHGNLQFLEDYSFFVPDDSIYINSGVVKVRFMHSTTTVNNQQEQDLDTQGAITESQALKLQIVMDRRSKIVLTLSNIMKKVSQTAENLVQNIK